MAANFVRADFVRELPVQWLWPGRIPRGALTVLEANPGDGKTSLLIDIAARETQGLSMPGTSFNGTCGDVV